MSENEERKEKRKKEKKDKKHKKEKKEKRDKTDVKEEDGETKAEGKAKKGRERKSRVSFLHERQTAPPPPRYSVGEEPPLPAFPITWSPIAVCVETSLPVFSRDALMDVLNAVGRPAMSMSVVHPLDLAEDEMRVEGTQLAAELVTAKIEGKRSWPPPDLLTKCLRSRSLLDRDKEHRLEELRRANLVLESRKATEDASAAVRAAAEGVKAAETLLKEYRAKLKEDRIKEVTAKRLAARAAKESEAAAEAAQKAETIIGGKKPKKDKKEKKEKEEKGLKDDNEKKEDKKEKKEKSKGKKGKGRDEDASVILLTPQEQWKLLEDGIAKAKAAVFEAEVQVEVCLENEAKVESTLNDPFKTGHVYCMLGLDSALPIAELCAEKNSFFRGVLNVSLKPKVPLILPESSGPNTPRDDDALSVASTSSVSSSKSADSKKRRKSRKEAKAAAKAAKVEAAVSAIPLLVSEIRSLKEACAVTDVLRRVAVLDVFYEPAPPLELDFFPELESMDQDRNYKKGMTQEGIEGEKEPKEKKKKEKNKKKADTEEKTGDGVEKKEKKEKKGKESKEGRKSKRGDIALPYKEIAQAIVAACQRLQVQVDLYNQMGGDTVRVFTVPAAKPLEEVDTSYYKRLISEVPRGLVSVPIIVHCLVEQVAAYSWPVQDIKAFEVANENTQLLRGMEEAFKKLGHPRWIGVDRDISSSLAKRFEMLYNFSQKDAAQSLIPDTGNQPESETDIKDTGRMPAPDPRETGSLNKEEVISKKSKEGSPTNDQATSAVKSKFSSRQPSKLETGGTNSGKDDSSAKKDDGDPVSDVKSPPEDESKESETIAGDMHVSADCGDCIMHEVGTGTCPVHHDHLDTDDAVELRKPEKREPPYDSLANPKDLEEHLNVTHEFDTVRRMLLTLIPHRQQFTSSVDVGKVEEHMSKIRATPGRGRRKMPVQPELSEEKMGAALTALQDLCEKYEEPRFPVGDKEAEFHCAEHLAGHPPSYGVPVQTVQRYKKLNTFFEMIKEDKLMLPDFDVPVKEPPKAPDLSPVDLVDSPDFSPHQIKDWCEICKRIFSQPGMRAKLPKFIEPPPERPSIRHRLSILERKKSLLEIIQEKKKSLTVDQDMFGSDTNISVALVDESDTGQEEQKLETDSPTLEELEHAERHYDTNPGLDSEKVKTWCPVCARIFAVPTPPDLQEIWKEGERMRLEMERLAQENEQAIIAAKIAAWERKKETLRQSIIGRRHAEGFADGVMGEVYARAKLLLPFELLRYDREEDCVLSILYAADGERTFYEEIPIYVPFGEFCLGDIDKIGPIKRLREAYELETRFRSIQDKRRYLLTEDGGLVVCGLPAMSLVQYEPRTTVIKFLTKVYEDKQGGREISRCVLPTGSVVSYKRNGQMQILLKDGNVSEYTAVPDKAALSKIPGVEKTSSDGNSLPNKANEFNFGWHTTNNKGLAAMKLPVPYIDPSKPESSPRGEGEERSSEEKKGKESEGKGGKGKDKGEGKEKEEGTGKEEGKGDRKQKEKMKASKDKAGKGETKLIDSPPERPATPFSDEEVDSGALKRTLEVPIPVDSVPHIEMPSKKVIEIYDPDTGSSILTREDLVVIVRTDDQSVRVVQHADGTHIYSEISDVSSSGYKPSAGQCMMDDVKRFNANATLATLCTASSRKYSELPANEADKIHMLGGISGKPSVPLKASSTMDVTSPDNKRSKDLTGKREVKSGPLSTPPVSAAPVSSEKTSVAGTQIDAVGAPRVNDVTGTVPHVAEPDKSQEFFTVKWHVRKDGFPNVQGNTKGGVAVDFCTVEGQYCATWSKESGQLSLLMPNGSMLYSCGKLVFFDPSDGSKKADPQQSLHDQVTEGRSFVNTNGLYEFNLEKASLSYTDNAGNGFRTSWGFKIDAIVSGKVPEPPPQAKVGCGIEGPVGIDKPVGQLDFTSQDDPLSSGTTEVYSKTSFSKVGPKDQPAGSMTGPDSRSPSGKKDMRVPPLKSDRKGDASQASKHRMPASGTLEVVQVLPSSSIPMEQNNLEEDSLVSVRDPGPASDISTASRPASVDGSQNEVPEEPYLGPYPRLFVIHEGGFGFEILHEDDLEKYAYSKVFKKECTRVMENYAKSDVVMHTFVTVEQKAKKLAELDVEKHEGCRAPDGLKLWTKKVPEFARRIKFRAVLSKMQKRTKCDWLQLGLELPFLPRAVAPEMLPVMPLSNVTYIMFRQIFEYASFESGQIRKMDKILEAYGEWQDSSMILTDVEVIPDQRTPQEKKKAEDIALRIRESKSYKRRESVRRSRYNTLRRYSEC